MAAELFDVHRGALHPCHYHRYLCIACLHWWVHIPCSVQVHAVKGKLSTGGLAGFDVCVQELHSSKPRCASLGELAFSWLYVHVMHDMSLGHAQQGTECCQHDASTRRCGAVHQHRQHPQFAAHPVAPQDLTIELNFCHLTSLIQ